MPPKALTLKQRLTALSLVPSSPTSPHGLNTPKAPPSPSWRRTFFNVNKGKRNAVLNREQEAHERVQAVMGKMIFQAGVDFETRPMVVLNASALPDPREVSYDLLLSRILSYLNLYVEADYTVVFFAAGGKHRPDWNWIWKAYRSLNRKYRKNLQRLYIVHSNLFSKMLFSLAGAIISPKFFRKLTYITTLSDLACRVPITQIDIPPAVYQENLQHERKVTLPTVSRSDIFGVPLEELMGYDGEKGSIPRVVKDCIQFIRDTDMEDEGLFRRSPNSALLRQAKEAYDRGHVVSMETFGDPHLAAVLLKKYIRDLPSPIFPESMYTAIRRCPRPTNNTSDISSVLYIRENILTELPPCVYILLNHILHLMHEVSLRAASNRMDAHNLAIVLCPNLVSSSNPARDVMMCSVPSTSASPNASSNPSSTEEGRTTLGMVIKLCIERYFEVFDEVRDRSETIPPRESHEPDLSEASLTSAWSPTRAGFPSEDDEDMDDEMLIMPIGPSPSAPNGSPPSPPTAWNASGPTYRHRTTSSKGSSISGVRSLHTVMGDKGRGTVGKAKSTISIEKGGLGNANRKGSIVVGRGTTRKSSGAGVEAISVTASGFFSAPEGAPPVPTIPSKTGDERHVDKSQPGL